MSDSSCWRTLEHVTSMNGGPLEHGTDENDANSFRSKTYDVSVATRPVTLYRLYGDKASSTGPFWSTEPYEPNPNNLRFKTEMAHLAEFRNSMTNAAKITLPPGTIVYKGVVGPQQSQEGPETRMGGGHQVFIPRNVVEKVVQYNQKGGSDELQCIFDAQKQYIGRWEAENYSLTQANGAPKPPMPVTTQTSGLLSYAREAGSVYCSPSSFAASASLPSAAQRVATQNIIQSTMNGVCVQAGMSSSSTFQSAPWPGGVELTAWNPPLIRHNGSVITPWSTTVRGRDVLVYRYPFSKTPMILLLDEDISAAEIECLRVACLERVNQGITLSMCFSPDRWFIEVDGINELAARELRDARNRIYFTVRDADVLLSDLIFGKTMRTNEKTVSPVSTYKNPFDVLIKLLQDVENSNVREDLKTFPLIFPYPKFRINPDAYYEVSDMGKSVTLRKGLTIDVRGQYMDAFGNWYTDDAGTRCHGNNPFRDDFASNYDEYLRKYGILRRLDSYAAIIGLILKTPRSSNAPKPSDDFSRFSLKKDGKEESSEVIRDQRHLLMLQESLALETSDPAHRSFTYTSLAEQWDAYDSTHAKELLLHVLQESDHIQFTDDMLRDKLVVRTCCLLLRYLRGLSGSENALLSNIFGVKETGDASQALQLEDNDDTKFFLVSRICYVMLPAALRREFWAHALELVRSTFQAVLDLMQRAGHDAQSVLASNQWHEAFAVSTSGMRDAELSLMSLVMQAKPTFDGTGGRRSTIRCSSILEQLELLPRSENLHPSDDHRRMELLALAYFTVGELALRDNNWRIGLCEAVVYHMRSCSAALHLLHNKRTMLQWMALAAQSAKTAFSAIDSLEAKRSQETVEENMAKIKALYVSGGKTTELMKLSNETKALAESLQNFEMSRRVSLLAAMNYSLEGDHDNASRWKRIAETVKSNR